jgi:hypothetical protein
MPSLGNAGPKAAGRDIKKVLLSFASEMTALAEKRKLDVAWRRDDRGFSESNER